MKQCDHSGLSPFAPPLAIDSSSLSDPEDSFWRDFTFDFSFLTSDEQRLGLNDDVPKAEVSEAVNAQLVKEEGESSKLSPSLALVSTRGFDSNVVTMVEERFPPSASVLGVTSITPVAKNDAIAKEKEVLVGKDINESHFSPLFTKMSALSIKECSVLSEKFSIRSEVDDTEVDSPCWRGTRSHNTAASSTKSLNFRRCRDDVNVLYGLNPLAPQFVPSNAKKKLDKNGKEFEVNSSSSLKRSLSSTFSPSLGEFSITDPSKVGIEQGSDQNTRILIHDGDESLGLVSQDSVSKAMSILDISNQFQSPKRLDPLAPVFVPASPKLSAVVHEKHGVADYLNAHSPDPLSSSDNRLLNCVKAEIHSSEVGHSFRNPYSNESGKAYSFNHRLGSQVQISENTKLDGSSNKTHGLKKLNPLAPQFSLAATKPQVYGSERNQAANDLPPEVNSSVLLSPIGYRNHNEIHAGLPQPSVHLRPSVKEVDTKQMGRNILHGNSSPQMDVKKLLTTIHGLSELLTHVHGSETSDPPNKQDLDLINCTVQNLNSYINSRAQEHAGNYAGALHSSRDFTSLPNMREQSIRDHQMAKYMSAKRKEKYSMVSREIGADSQFQYGVTKENGFGQVARNHQTEEQINPQVYFYRSLWLKAKADRSLMEYETFLSNSRT